MKLLLTAGPTREYLDPVRFLSNPSSGRMGYAIAEEAARRGYEVVLVSGPVELSEPIGIRTIRVVSAQEMLSACLAEFADCDAAVMAAAVCDYRPVKRHDRKQSKPNAAFSLELIPNEDICARLGAMKGCRVVVGFALEDHDHQKHAEAKLRRKKCDAIVMNDLSNLNEKQARVRFLTAAMGWMAPMEGSKVVVAAAIVDLVEELAESRAADNL